MDEKPTILDQAFDHLSSIPYLNIRRFCKGLWVVSTICFGLAILVQGIAIFKGKAELSLEWFKNFMLWAGVNPFFAYLLYLWNKRESISRANSKKTS